MRVFLFFAKSPTPFPAWCFLIRMSRFWLTKKLPNIQKKLYKILIEVVYLCNKTIKTKKYEKYHRRCHNCDQPELSRKYKWALFHSNSSPVQTGKKILQHPCLYHKRRIPVYVVTEKCTRFSLKSVPLERRIKGNKSLLFLS